MTVRDLLMAASGTGAAETYVDDVFNTTLYTGNASSQSIVNGIDLSTNPGMVWIKRRNTAENHFLFDTTRGATNEINFNTTDANAALANSLTAFNTNGFSLGSATGVNTTAGLYAAWTFRKADKFFDVISVSHTSGGSDTTVDLSLLGTVGMVMMKNTAFAAAWWIWHRSLTAGNNLRNTTAAQTTTTPYLSVSGTTLSISSATPSANYTIYVWAHDIDNGSRVQCGTYTGNGSATGPIVSLGWEPQFLLIKRRDNTGGWTMLDVTRGLPIVGNHAALLGDSTTAETITARIADVTSDGFQLASTATNTNANAGVYVYMAIRRSNKPPSSGASVFAPVVYTGTNADNRLLSLGIEADTVLLRRRNGSGAGFEGFLVADRRRGQEWFKTESAGPVGTITADGLDQQLAATEWGTAFSSSTGIYIGNAGGVLNTSPNINLETTANNHIALALKRASGFFEQVLYVGNATSSMAISHGLGVMPEMVWIKRRDSNAMNFIAWHKALTSVNHQVLIDTTGGMNGPYTNEISDISSTHLTLGAGSPNASAGKFIAYLFASRSGVSSVGSYVGNGSSQTINCGFAAGARFIMVKNRAGGSWYIFDSARGIATGNDPYLLTNSTVAEGTTLDSIDPDSSGFTVNSDALALNTNAATYIYLAIA